MAALFNAIYMFYSEYTAAHNEQQVKFKCGTLIQETPSAGTEFITF